MFFGEGESGYPVVYVAYVIFFLLVTIPLTSEMTSG